MGYSRTISKSTTIVTTPTGFNWDISPIIIISQNEKGKFSVGTFDVSYYEIAVVGGSPVTYYIDPVNGIDNTDADRGTITKPFKSLTYAISAHGSDGKVFICRGGIYFWTSGLGSGYKVTPTSALSIKAYPGEKVIFVCANLALTWSLESGTCYKATRSNVGRIVDAKYDDVLGDHQELTLVASVEDCISTSGSWYTDNTTIWVHAADNRAITTGNTDIRPYFKNIIPIEAHSGVDLYLEGIDVEGGSNCVHFVNTTGATGSLYVKNCTFKYSFASPGGLSVEGANYVYLQNCTYARNAFDGFNSHIRNSVIASVLEINCVGRHNGIADTNSTNNGSTIHDGGKIVRINNVYWDNQGPNIGDINTGTQAWNLGCIAYGSTAGTDPTHNTNFMAHANAEVWNDGCYSYGSTYAYVVETGAKMHNRNCRMEGLELLEGTGQVNTYEYSNKLPPNLEANKRMHFIKKVADNWFLLRTYFDSAKDMVRACMLDKAISYPYPANNVNHLYSNWFTYLVPNTNDFDTISHWNAEYVNYHSVNDDLCPLNYNGSYMGGSHGVNCVRVLTVTSHDKTDADLGSSWSDGTNTWYLVRILDSTRLWVIRDFGTDGTNGYWTFNTVISGTTLTHVSGATHTSNIVFASSVIDQFNPSVKNITLKVLLDGQIEPMDNTLYECAFVDVVQEYDIADPRTTLAYMKAHIGTTIGNALLDSLVTTDVHMLIRHRYYPDNSEVIYHEITTVNYLNLLQFGGIQSQALVYTGKNLYEYIPRVLPYVGSVKTWDFTTPELISGTFEQIVFDSTKWKDVNKPPFRFTQILKDSSDIPILGFTLGFSLSKLDTVDSVRKNRLSSAFMIASERKSYPRVLNGSGIAGGNTYKAQCYRKYFDPNSINGATVYEYHQEGSELIVDIDFHINVTGVHMPLPSGWHGKIITVLDSDGSITVPSTVNGDGITVSVTGGYGSATLKIA